MILRWWSCLFLHLADFVRQILNGLGETFPYEAGQQRKVCLPAAGHRFEVAGELEESRRAQAALFSSVPYCAAAIVIVLVWQFNSIRRPLVIFLTIPLALIGAVLGLLATGASFGFMATLGLLSLAGIIINNAIVLIDRIDSEIAEGRAPWDAVLMASVRRLRPILMTALTTILGLMPLMLFGGPLWFGMATVIAFGLGVGTLLTLGVVPVLYALLFRVEEPALASRAADEKGSKAAGP